MTPEEKKQEVEQLINLLKDVSKALNSLGYWNVLAFGNLAGLAIIGSANQEEVNKLATLLANGLGDPLGEGETIH